MLLLLLAAPLYLSIVHVNVVQFSCQIFFGLYNNVLPTLVLQFIGSAGLPCPACYGSKVTPITQLKLGTITSSHDDALTLWDISQMQFHKYTVKRSTNHRVLQYHHLRAVYTKAVHIYVRKRYWVSWEVYRSHANIVPFYFCSILGRHSWTKWPGTPCICITITNIAFLRLFQANAPPLLGPGYNKQQSSILSCSNATLTMQWGDWGRRSVPSRCPSLEIDQYIPYVQYILMSNPD